MRLGNFNRVCVFSPARHTGLSLSLLFPCLHGMSKSTFVQVGEKNTKYFWCHCTGGGRERYQGCFFALAVVKFLFFWLREVDNIKQKKKKNSLLVRKVQTNNKYDPTNT